MAGFLSTIYGKLTQTDEQHYIDIFMAEIGHLGLDEDELFNVLGDYFEHCGIVYSEAHHANMREVEWTLITLDLKHYSTPEVEKRVMHFLDFVESCPEGR